MHFSNFLNFRPLNNSLELWIIFSWISLPKGTFWQNKNKKFDFLWVFFDSRYSQKMTLKKRCKRTNFDVLGFFHHRKLYCSHSMIDKTVVCHAIVISGRHATLPLITAAWDWLVKLSFLKDSRKHTINHYTILRICIVKGLCHQFLSRGCYYEILKWSRIFMCSIFVSSLVKIRLWSVASTSGISKRGTSLYHRAMSECIR